MRYALLLSYDEKADGDSEADTTQAFGEFFRHAGERLQITLRLLQTSAATTVRVRHGDLVIADGPFAETKEQMGGILVVDCADLDEAIEIASRCPMAQVGTVEIRPLKQPPGTRTPKSGTQPQSRPTL
jgi:hypothetical protein